MYTVLTVLFIGLLVLAFVILRAGYLKPVSVKSQGQNDGPAFIMAFFLKNNEHNIEWLIRRLMLLCYGNYESFKIILIDRGSTDRTLEIIGLLQRDYPAVELVNGVGALVTVERLLHSPAGSILVMEEVPLEQEGCNLIITKMKALLKKGERRSWDQGPNKIETREEYNINGQNDKIN